MGKETTTITLDSELKKIARDKGLNISQLTEKAIREKSGEITINPEEAKACEFCGEELEKATTKKHKTGLVWLWPDERWWCQQCHPKLK